MNAGTDMRADEQSRKGEPADLLKAWAKAGGRHERLSALLGVAQYVLFIGFAWARPRR